MPGSARLCLVSGLLVLGLAVFNALTAGSFPPALQRAEVLSGMAAVGLMLVAVLWTRAVPRHPKAVKLEGEQGLEIAAGLAETLRTELAWGSHQFLTATSAATILVNWDGTVLLRRGLITKDPFCPGEICRRSTERQALVSLVRTALYPGRQEFDAVLPGLPAVMVQPLGERGWIVLGGWSERCFTRSDERWLVGWAERLRTQLELISVDADPDQEADPKGT
jgi:hypothetical protein|tara:strand:+ start:290 stop:955 length:666 start_codon:yes stop_codon:yes gene_type:complete